jgi:IS1 family transposase/transposase-like protein
MIVEEKRGRCTKCKSVELIKNGRTKEGKQKYRCKGCGGYGTVNPGVKYTAERKAEILRSYHERASLRGVARIFGVARQTVSKWMREEDKTIPDTPPLDPSEPEDILELDEMWSFVASKKNVRWVWIALCRRTRQVVSYFIGGRTQKDCEEFWSRIPPSYRHCATFSDFYQTYQSVFSTSGTKHQSVGKETGQTAHVERWNNTLRQRCSRFVRKTLSFSKSDTSHLIAFRRFIHSYNLSLSVIN